jgi:predicted metalloendopeptidase
MFTQVNDRVQKQLLTLLEESAADRNAKPGSNPQILGDWYASYIDESAIEAAGLTPLKLALDRRAVKIGCIGDNLLQVGRLGIIGEVADTHVFDHPLT